ncbi:conserved hypothetical protein [Pseudomonas sp. 9AZ]|uniref:hypothetical protein n=1 Tax=Pseudomonas sp. 9AZ TaxID=2653168 RepID=UPI0012F24A05|nr:hypothetical protein [Pseudomonas sp. 9AZ]VXC15501.1 conserved hypothetical protein [Pseudomonas sp. 9AZ]
MADMTLIATALSGIKTATDIARLLKDSDFSLEKAELKLKLAELVGALADVKIELSEIQEKILEKDKCIQELKDAFQSKSTIKKYGDAYYKIDASGKATGAPYCLKCWEVDHKKRPLVILSTNRFTHVCPACSHQYTVRRTPFISNQSGSSA